MSAGGPSAELARRNAQNLARVLAGRHGGGGAAVRRDDAQARVAARTARRSSRLVAALVEAPAPARGGRRAGADGGLATAARVAAPAVVSVTARSRRRATRMPTTPLPLLLRRRRAGDAAARGPRLRRDRLARRLPADQPPRGRGRRRDRGPARRRPPGTRNAGRQPTPRPTSPCSRSSSSACRWSRSATRASCRSATRCWPSATRSTSARRSPRASSARSTATRLGSSPFQNFIQTDAAINPGNSRRRAGRRAAGQLVGINTAIYSRSGGSMGIGFAVPVDTARAGDGSR